MLQDILDYYSIKTRRQVKLYKHENVRWPHHRVPRAACFTGLVCTGVNLSLSTPWRRGEVGVLGRLHLAVALDGVRSQNQSLVNYHLPVPIEYENEWGPELVSTHWRKDVLTPASNQTTIPRLPRPYPSAFRFSYIIYRHIASYYNSNA